MIGSVEPRLHTPWLEEQPSRGHELIAFAESVGFPLLPYQQRLAIESHRLREDGRWAARTCGLTIARQNGKSAFMRMVILWNLFELGTQRVLSMAQNRALALDQFKQAVELVEGIPELAARVKRINRTNGSEALILDNGAQWQIVAATMEGPRGRTADLLWIDELREIGEPAWKAATPTTRARMNARAWVTSNAGDAHSTVLNDLRGRALTSVDPSVFWAEYSSDPQLRPDDPEGWAQANPALGHLIDLDVIRQAQQTDKPEAFMTETLCRWVDSIESPWPYGKWDESEQRLVIPAGRPTWIAYDVTPDRRRADIVAGTQLEDGRIAIELLDTYLAESVIDDRVVASGVMEHVRRLQAATVAYDQWTGDNIRKLIDKQVPVREMSGRLFASACDAMLTNLNAGRIVHAGQQGLTDAMNAAAKKPMADGGWRIIRRSSSGAISAAVAAIMCVYLADEPPPIVDIIAV